MVQEVIQKCYSLVNSVLNSLSENGNIGYHIGASIKDAGKKCFGINKIEDEVVIKELIKRTEMD